MMLKRCGLGLLASVFIGSAVLAADSNLIRSKMELGEYSTAYEAAKVLETVEAQALAAEILLTEIMLGRVEKNKKQAKRARKIAKAALEIDPMHQNARLQYAIADGFVTRETGDVSAWMKKLPQKTHVIVQAYRNDFPTDPRGDALLGAWHLAIARKAGNKNAKKWFDASITQGRELFLAARARQPQDAVIGVNYAFSLLALEDDDLASIDEARIVLNDMAAITPDDHLGRSLQSYGLEALARIDDRDAVRDYAGMFLDGERPE